MASTQTTLSIPDVSTAQQVANPHASMFGNVNWCSIPHEQQAKVALEEPLYRPAQTCVPMSPGGALSGGATPPTSPGFKSPGLDPNRTVKSANGIVMRPSLHAAAVYAETMAEMGSAGKVGNQFAGTFGNTCYLRERYNQEHGQQ